MGLRGRLRSREVLTFLAVGGCGYLVDVVSFNALLSVGPLAGRDPIEARTLAVVVATVVTYSGNRWFTWRSSPSASRSREVSLFALFNVVGLLISVACLAISHDLLGLTSRIADNLSANVIGVGLGMIFRFWSYRRFVFAPAPAAPGERLHDPTPVAPGPDLDGPPLVLARADMGGPDR